MSRHLSFYTQGQCAMLYQIIQYAIQFLDSEFYKLYYASCEGVHSNAYN